jgi:hypothetical protein
VRYSEIRNPFVRAVDWIREQRNRRQNRVRSKIKRYAYRAEAMPDATTIVISGTGAICVVRLRL